jgi:hypothetical protein
LYLPSAKNTIPTTGTYTLTVAGAQGGDNATLGTGGSGALLQGLTPLRENSDLTSQNIFWSAGLKF